MKIERHGPGNTNHLIALVLSWGVFSILYGLFHTFDILEVSKGITLLQATISGIIVSVITFLLGTIVVGIPLLVLKFRDKKASV